MDRNSNNKKTLFFDENFSQVSSDVLKKYKLEETSEEIIEKIKTEKKLLGETFMEIIGGVIRGLINETEFVSLLKSKLNLSEDDAKNLVIDTKEKIIPLIKEVEVSAEEPAPKIFPNIKPPINTIGIKVPENIKNEELAKNKKTEKIKKSVIPEKPVPQSSQPKGLDNYREPIEKF